MEEQEEAYEIPLKFGNFLLNQFGVNEDAAFELIGVYHLQKSSTKMAYQENKEYKNFEKERNKKGMDINHSYVMNHFIRNNYRLLYLFLYNILV